MKNLHAVVLLLTKDNDFGLEQAATAEETAGKLSADLEILCANDSIQQSQQSLKFVQADPDDRLTGIIFEPVGGLLFSRWRTPWWRLACVGRFALRS